MRKGWKRIHRLVVLPDYQGVGIGVGFINEVSKIIARDGFCVNLSTTTPALVGALKKSSSWRLFRRGIMKPSGVYSAKYKKNEKYHRNFNGSVSAARPTFSFNFIGDDKPEGAGNG